jgi:hypothetical protein
VRCTYSWAGVDPWHYCVRSSGEDIRVVRVVLAARRLLVWCSDHMFHRAIKKRPIRQGQKCKRTWRPLPCLMTDTFKILRRFQCGIGSGVLEGKSSSPIPRSVLLIVVSTHKENKAIHRISLCSEQISAGERRRERESSSSVAHFRSDPSASTHHSRRAFPGR